MGSKWVRRREYRRALGRKGKEGSVLQFQPPKFDKSQRYLKASLDIDEICDIGKGYICLVVSTYAFILRVSALRQVVAWNKARRSGLSHDFSFPPAVVLVSEDSQDVTFGKSKLLGNGSCVAVHRSSYRSTVSKETSEKGPKSVEEYNLPKCRTGRPSRLYCLLS